MSEPFYKELLKTNTFSKSLNNSVGKSKQGKISIFENKKIKK